MPSTGLPVGPAVRFMHPCRSRLPSPSGNALGNLFLQPKKRMGQALGVVQDMFHGKDWKERQVRKITDKVFDRFKNNESEKLSLSSDDLYISVLLVYNDLNKHLPGPHVDPPSQSQLKAIMEANDLNMDGELDREEFAGFIKKLTSDTLAVVSQGLIIALVLAPVVALMTKRATEGVPGIGRVVQKLPNSVYASLATVAAVFLQQEGKDVE